MASMENIPEIIYWKKIIQRGNGISALEQSKCTVIIENLQQDSDPAQWDTNILGENSIKFGELKEIVIGNAESRFQHALERCIMTMVEGETSEVILLRKSEVNQHDRVLICDAEESSEHEEISPCTIEEISDEGESQYAESAQKSENGSCSEMASECQINNYTTSNVGTKLKVKLQSVDQCGKDILEMSAQDKLDIAVMYKEKGSKLFQIGEIGMAFNYYIRALKYVLIIGKDDLSSEIKENCIKVKTLCFLNIAACQLLNKNYSSVVTNCSKALEYEPRNIKGLFRRVQAHQALGELDAAEKDLKLALEIEPSNKAVARQLESLQLKIRQGDAKLSQTYSKMFL